MLDPLVGVGPLRFGMSREEVESALDQVVPDPAWDRGGSAPWQEYRDEGVTVFYGPGSRLVAVAIDALSGPLVRLRGVELIARVPSEARVDLLEVARQEGRSVGVNRGGDPEVAGWGVSMGADQEWGRAAEGHNERRNRAITTALLVGPELATDPYGSEPVVRWRGVRKVGAKAGAWLSTSGRERPRWGWTPMESVGPLRFGMSPSQVAAALGGAAPAAREGAYPRSWPSVPPEAGQWRLHEDVFEETGVTAHYGYWADVPVLGAVTVHGLTGPQIEFEGIPLIGRPVADVDADIIRHIEDRGAGLRLTCAGDQGPDGTNMYVRAVRAGDTMLSEARFCVEEWWEE
ncbi:hypothetical protein ACFXPX_22115 [Kitasatospora sp. NPDC059146]|uniref:hypothetical protein n=1 Tax=unclassified Kitasatospora TaxID=2633591 RepID=UPI003692EAB7